MVTAPNEAEAVAAALAGGAEVDPRNRRYDLFQADVELAPGCVTTFRLYRGGRFRNTPPALRNYWWFWLCPVCRRRCRYLYTRPASTAACCRVCWNLPYRSQSKSRRQRQREYWQKNRHLYRQYAPDSYGGWYEYRQGVFRCLVPPAPPTGWVPQDLLRRFRTGFQGGTDTRGTIRREPCR